MAHMQDSSDPTGVRELEGGTKAAARARERKANAALELRIEGHEWADIASIVGYPTARAALVAVEGALEKSLGDESSKKAIRELASKRLNKLLRSVWDKANNPMHPDHLVAHQRALATIAQYTKLHGADAASELVVHSPAEQEIAAFVAQVMSASRPDVEEADIFGELEDPAIYEAEVVEDEPEEVT